MSRLWALLNRNPAVTALIASAFVVAVAVGLIAWQDDRQDRQRDELVACVADWADQLTERADQLDAQAEVVRQTEDRLWRAFDRALGPNAAPREQARQEFAGLLGEYTRAADEFADRRREHPIPTAPRLECAR